MNRKLLQCIYHVNVNVNLMEKDVIQINGGIMINVNVTLKNVIYVKKIMFGIPLHIAVKMETFYQVLWLIQQIYVIVISYKI